MRKKIIKRFAAGTFSVCFAYAMIRQPFNTVQGTGEVTADWKKIAVEDKFEFEYEDESTGQQGAEYGDGTTGQQEDEYGDETTGQQGAEYGDETIDQQEDENGGETIDQQEDEYGDETIGQQDDNYEDETIGQQEDAGGDKPTLAQFLSGMICGGCHRRCLLISPSCMRGQMKAERAAEEYYETYGE